MFVNESEVSRSRLYFLFHLAGIQQAWMKKSLENRREGPSERPVALGGRGG